MIARNEAECGMTKLRVLFISRKHPPSVGGMENLSYHLIREVSLIPNIQARAIVWRHGQLLLPVFGLYALIRGVWVCLSGVDVIHIGDPILALLGLFLGKLFHRPTAITVHGLDMTFSMPLYQALVPKWVAKYDRVICISRLAYEVSIERHVPAARCVIIPPGTDLIDIASTKSESRRRLAQHVGCDWDKAKILLTVGRLIPRKGVFFFVDQVLPQLVQSDPAFVYVAVGTGPDFDRISQAVERHGLQQHVFLTGYLPPDLLQQAYTACDLFVAPNVPQPHDVEGFGLIVLEAAAQGCSVLVSDLEGLRDTIPADSGACFVPAGEPELWQRQILALFSQPDRLIAAGERARDFVRQERTWPAMAEKYVHEFRKLMAHD
jgi:glycosyltransferase involved in cell wall biosynthesis